MKNLLIATAALSLLAAPAFAQVPTDVPMTGHVTGLCGGGAADPFAGSLLIDGDLTGADGRLNVGPQTITLDGLWCNGPAHVVMIATQLVNWAGGSDPFDLIATPVPPGVPFVSTLDMHVSGGAVAFFGAGTLVSNPVSGAPGLSLDTDHAFSMPNQATTVEITLPAGASATDRPLAGPYFGIIALVVTPIA